MSNSLWPPCTVAHQALLSFTIFQSLLEFMSIELVMLSNHLIFCCLLLYLFSISPSIRVFSSESALHIRWPKDSSFSFSISPSNEYSGLIAFRIDWLDLPAVQGALKSLLQRQNFKASSALSLLYGPTLTSVHDYYKNHSSVITFLKIGRELKAFIPFENEFTGQIQCLSD